jgi:sugar/nucleoside kinase (ribokinase family)
MKYRNVKIEYVGEAIYNETLKGAAKNKKPEYIRELMEKADSLLPNGSECVLYFQQQNAKGWAEYWYVTGSGSALLQ